MCVDIMFTCKNGGEKLECQSKEANEQDPYAVAIVKRTAGRKTKVVGHMPRSWNISNMYVVCFFRKVEISNVQ